MSLLINVRIFQKLKFNVFSNIEIKPETKAVEKVKNSF